MRWYSLIEILPMATVRPAPAVPNIAQSGRPEPRAISQSKIPQREAVLRLGCFRIKPKVTTKTPSQSTF